MTATRITDAVVAVAYVLAWWLLVGLPRLTVVRVSSTYRMARAFGMEVRPDDFR
jgi:hypothetical protein